MPKMVFHKDTETRYLLGVEMAALFVWDATTNAYKTGVPINGVKNITDSHDGGEANDYYGDNTLLFSVQSTIKTSGSIEAYGMPDEFDQCVGMESPEGTTGLVLDDQSQVPFAMVYRNSVGNKNTSEASYDYHFVWGAKATPGEISHDTTEEDIDIPTVSYDFSCVPVEISTTKADGSSYKPVAHAVIHTATLSAAQIKAIEDKVYGTDDDDPTMPTPDELITLCKSGS